jgi:hypothetical protein
MTGWQFGLRALIVPVPVLVLFDWYVLPGLVCHSRLRSHLYEYTAIVFLKHFHLQERTEGIIVKLYNFVTYFWDFWFRKFIR